MDRRLFEAASTGNVDQLLRMVNENPCVLYAVPMAGGETALHIASMVGHLSFVKETIKLRQEFAAELNQDGFSPLHLASANGHIDIVKVLLQADHNLSLIKGTERRIPLHCAVIKGKVHIIRELLSASPDSIAYTTARGETALHLAVKNSQFEVLENLIDHLKQLSMEDFVNKKDKQGNSILHLAISRKQYEVVDLLLNGHIVSKGAVDVNSVNEKGLTPLDVVLMFENEVRDRETEEILLSAGAVKAMDLQPLSQAMADTQTLVVPIGNLSNNQSVRVEQHRTPSKQLQDFFKYNKTRDSPGEVRNTLLVIAVLIATTTYQAVLSPPGGFWQDDLNSSSNNGNGTNSSKSHIAGQAVMGSKRLISYYIFVIFNSIGFFTAIYSINFLTVGFPLQWELQISLVALVVTYDTSMSAIAPIGALSMAFSIIAVVLPILIPVLAKLVRDYLERSRENFLRRSQTNA